MKAAVVEGFGKPLVLRKGVMLTQPFTSDHEGIGLVVAIGSGVTNVKNGDSVGVHWQPLIGNLTKQEG